MSEKYYDEGKQDGGYEVASQGARNVRPSGYDERDVFGNVGIEH